MDFQEHHGPPWSIHQARRLERPSDHQVAPNEFRRDFADHHLSRGVWKRNEDDDYDDLITKFLAVRPDGIAFNAEGRECVFFEFTRPMDSWEGSSEELED